MRPVFFSALVLALAACAPPTSSTPIEIRDAYAAPSPAGVDMAAGYLTVANSGSEDDRLLSASSPRAADVSLHTMAMDGVVMRMRRVDAMIAPAHGELMLSPGGDHLMFSGLSAPFLAGENIPVTLTFEHGGTVETSLEVRGGAGLGGH